MNPLTPDQLVALQKTNVDLYFDLAGKVVDGMAKMTELNMQVARSAFVESQKNVLKALSATQPSELSTLPAGVAEPVPEQVQSYARNLFEIASGVLAEFNRVAQVQVNAYDERLQTLVEEVGKSAPAGSEAAVAAWKSAIETTSSFYDTMQRSYQQATQAVQSNVAAAAEAAPKAVRRAAEQTSAGGAKH
ncbi:MAG TPA: phasin family protein [Trinickia sp.]|jgi:phasin family protein|nr:phasin family protein [Trinickia sp.]